MRKRLTAHFSGTVQGVGFRYMAQGIARRFPVTGYVKNLRNGQVELVAEAEEKVLREFLKAVRESDLADYIRDVNVEWAGATGEFRGFDVAF